MPERAASMLNPRPEPVEGVENLGGSTRVNGEAVFLRFSIPIRFRAGERPAGADRGVVFASRRGAAGERAVRIGRRGEASVCFGFRKENSLGLGGAFVRKNLDRLGLRKVSLLVPSGHLERLGERKMIGSMFSALSSSSNDEALRLVGEVRARGEEVRFMLIER